MHKPARDMGEHVEQWPRSPADRKSSRVPYAAGAQSKKPATGHEGHSDILYKVVVERSCLRHAGHAHVPAVRIGKHPDAVDQMAKSDDHKQDPYKHFYSPSLKTLQVGNL